MDIRKAHPHKMVLVYPYVPNTNPIAMGSFKLPWDPPTKIEQTTSRIVILYVNKNKIDLIIP